MITSASSSSISLFSNIVYPVRHKPIHKLIATLKRFKKNLISQLRATCLQGDLDTLCGKCLKNDKMRALRGQSSPGYNQDSTTVEALVALYNLLFHTIYYAHSYYAKKLYIQYDMDLDAKLYHYIIMSVLQERMFGFMFKIQIYKCN